ncbi:WSC-domain-containing protein, partial [Aureobasidium melanogenum]
LATVQTCANSKVATIGAYEQYFKDVTSSLKWQYVGCGTDNVGSRTFTAASTSSNSMTIESCISFCSGKGYSYAGLEYASQCYCGNSLPSDRAPQTGILGNCFTPCAGDSTEYCGGGSALSIYQNCSGLSSCTNNAYTGPDGGSVSSASSSVAASSSAASSSKSSSSSSSSSTTSTSSSKTATTLATSSKPASSSSSKSSATSSISSALHRKGKAPASATKNARYAAAVAYKEAADEQAAEVKAKLAAGKVRRHLAELKAGRHH